MLFRPSIRVLSTTIITAVFIITNSEIIPAYALRQPQAKGTSMAGAIGMDLDRTASAIGTAETEQCSGIRVNRDPSVPTAPIASFAVIDARPERIDRYARRDFCGNR